MVCLLDFGVVVFYCSGFGEVVRHELVEEFIVGEIHHSPGGILDLREIRHTVVFQTIGHCLSHVSLGGVFKVIEVGLVLRIIVEVAWSRGVNNPKVRSGGCTSVIAKKTDLWCDDFCYAAEKGDCCENRGPVASRLVFSPLLFFQSLVFVRVVSVSRSQKLLICMHRLCRQRHKSMLIFP